jgi:hypothetical protein
VSVGLGSSSTGICSAPDSITWAENTTTDFSTEDSDRVTANAITISSAFFVAVGGQVIATSTDGVHWTVTNISAATTVANVVALDSNGVTPNVYVGDQNGNVIVAATPAGIATATPINLSASPIRCASAAFGVALVGDAAGNIFRSSDGGATWHLEDPGLGTLVLTSIVSNSELEP